MAINSNKWAGVTAPPPPPPSKYSSQELSAAARKAETLFKVFNDNKEPCLPIFDPVLGVKHRLIVVDPAEVVMRSDDEKSEWTDKQRITRGYCGGLHADSKKQLFTAIFPPPLGTLLIPFRPLGRDLKVNDKGEVVRKTRSGNPDKSDLDYDFGSFFIETPAMFNVYADTVLAEQLNKRVSTNEFLPSALFFNLTKDSSKVNYYDDRVNHFRPSTALACYVIDVTPNENGLSFPELKLFVLPVPETSNVGFGKLFCTAYENLIRSSRSSVLPDTSRRVHVITLSNEIKDKTKKGDQRTNRSQDLSIDVLRRGDKSVVVSSGKSSFYKEELTSIISDEVSLVMATKHQTINDKGEKLDFISPETTEWIQKNPLQSFLNFISNETAAERLSNTYSQILHYLGIDESVEDWMQRNVPSTSKTLGNGALKRILETLNEKSLDSPEEKIANSEGKSEEHKASKSASQNPKPAPLAEETRPPTKIPEDSAGDFNDDDPF